MTACVVCGESLGFAPKVAIAGVCELCRRAHPHFDFAVSFGAYDGVLRRLLHLLKYEQIRPIADLLGGRLAAVISGCDLKREKPILVVPVPLYRAKRRQRGFNQSEVIARGALRHLDRSGFELHAGNLCRERETVSQTGLTRHQRRENVRGAFVVKSPELIRDRTLLLLDDVYTTGTTLNACARVLRRAGAREIVVATVARVYRTAAEIAPGGMQKEAAFSEAVAG